MTLLARGRGRDGGGAKGIVMSVSDAGWTERHFLFPFHRVITLGTNETH